MFSVMQSCHRVVNWTPFSGVALRPLRKRQEVQGTAWGAGALGAVPRGAAGSQVPQSGGPLGVTGVLCSF